MTAEVNFGQPDRKNAFLYDFPSFLQRFLLLPFSFYKNASIAWVYDAVDDVVSSQSLGSGFLVLRLDGYSSHNGDSFQSFWPEAKH